jgi:alpha-tubulin suppressor-like RCC1 family protein
MNRAFLSVFAILPVALSMAFVSNAEANNCNPPVDASGETVAWAWGWNGFCQLGDGTTQDRDTPIPVQLSGVTAVAGGFAHSLGLTTDRRVWAWGWNSHGQLGDGTTEQRHAPVQVENLSGVTAVAAGGQQSLALKSDGTVSAWGRNDVGQLGDGTTTESHTPVQVHNLSGVTAVAAGQAHNLALKSDGTVWAWGANDVGQLGDGTTTPFQPSPVQVHNLREVTCIAAGDNHSLARRSDGTVWAWGGNGFGQLGDGIPGDSHTPMQVRDLGEVTAVAGGAEYSLALKSDGTVWGWGANDLGQLGDGTPTNFQPSPVQVISLTGVTAITVSGEALHSLALRITAPPFDGVVEAWGWNFSGQLGDGSDGTTTPSRPFPAQVATVSAAEAIATGTRHSLAVGARRAYLNVRDILVHPDMHHRRLFNLRIHGVVVRANDNGGNTGFQSLSTGIHTVDETGGTGTPQGAFGVVIGGDCAADGAINLALASVKICTITNYDHEGGCVDKGGKRSICCEPGDGTQGCLVCSKPGQGCPGR